MHNYTYGLLILVLSLLSTTKYVSSDDSDIRNRAVLLGYGYSSDSEQVTKQACFKATVARITDQTTRIELTSSVSTSELQKTFGVNLNAKGSYGQFDADGKAEYLRSIQEDESSVSLNYYVVNQEEVTVNITDVYDDALTYFGQKVYHNKSLNKYFGLQCGNHYIASYNQGAVLFVGLNIVLNSKEDKVKLESNFNGKFGPFIDVASKIQSASNEKEISGTVQIRAYQFGGEPSELTGVLTPNIADCDIKDMSGCKKVVQDLLSYANKFEKQIKNGKDLEALGSFDFIPIERLGLKAPKSLVTPDVKQSRNDLAIKLKENRYYARKLLPLANDEYPVKLSDKLIAHIKSLFNNAKHNVELIMDSKKGAARCFNTPENCKVIKTDIYDNLMNITSKDLKFLKGMKYIFSWVPNGVDEVLFFNTGEGLKTWKMKQKELAIEMVKFNLSKKSLEYQFRYKNGYCNFTSTRALNTRAYEGIFIYSVDDREREFHATQKIYPSRYFFEEYSGKIDTA